MHPTNRGARQADPSVSVCAATMVNVGAFVGGTVLACALKLTTSVDDLIWFSPFLALCKDNQERFKCCIIYAIVCFIVTIGALTIAYLADLGFTAILGAAGNDGDGYWDSARILSLVAAVAIGAYAGKEYREWVEDEENRLPTAAESLAAIKSCVATLCKPATTYKPVGEDEENDSVGSSSPRRGQKTGSADSAEGLELEVIEDGEDEEDGHFAGATVAVSTGGAVKLMPDDEVNDFNEEAAAASDRTLPSPFREIDESQVADGAAESAEEGSAVPAAQKVPLAEEEVADTEQELDEDELEAQKTIEEARKSSTRLFVVALCGTLDDMTMFAAVILGKSILYTSLVAGSMLATGIIIVACWQISLYKPFAECIQKVPMWALLSALSAYIMIGGLAR